MTTGYCVVWRLGNQRVAAETEEKGIFNLIRCLWLVATVLDHGAGGGGGGRGGTRGWGASPICQTSELQGWGDLRESPPGTWVGLGE